MQHFISDLSDLIWVFSYDLAIIFYVIGTTVIMV